ncbi:hypothetical protein K439DRAFT_1172244 [Ramaria rubella]|nr:hypothetical protein K439DRAFT_1172244 [Ramaria rubella]
MTLQLHRLAPNYWHRQETADCTIIVPYGAPQRDAAQPPRPDLLTTGPFGDQAQSRVSSRRDSEPATNTQVRRMVLKLHQDYLSAQSTFMRALLSGLSPLDLSIPVPSTSTSTSTIPTLPLPPPSPTSHLAAGAFPVHPSRHPRVLPSSSSHHPIIFLPVPDPQSFPHLVHYLYFGTFNHIEESLHRGTITWQGTVRNVEYLGMRLELKAALGRYYRQWLKPNTSQEPRSQESLSSEDNEDEGNSSDVSHDSTDSRGNEEHPPPLP